MNIDTDLPVMVTGATGYVAGWLVQRLLEAGLTVHAAVRDPDSPDKLAHLQRIAAGKPGTMRYFRADLLEPGSYADAMAGCGTVFHTASPFTVTVRVRRRRWSIRRCSARATCSRRQTARRRCGASC